MVLAPGVTSEVAVAAAGVAVVALAAATLALTRLTRLRHDYALLVGGSGADDLVGAVAGHARGVEGLRGDVGRLAESLARAQGDLADALRHVAVVRYDAFQDMGGRLSFSAALLDDAGDGLVLTSINGRSETRTYAKGVKGGASEATLSPEELQVITHARAAARG